MVARLIRTFCVTAAFALPLLAPAVGRAADRDKEIRAAGYDPNIATSKNYMLEYVGKACEGMDNPAEAWGKKLDQYVRNLDRGNLELMEIVRAAFVVECLPPVSKMDANTYGAYAVCGHDARLLNKDKLEAEIQQLKLSKKAADNVREIWAGAKAKADRAKKVAEETKHLTKRFFDDADKAWEE